MLEIRSYSKPELTEMFGTKSCQGLVRKLARYNVDFETDGKGEQTIYKINAIYDPFKIYAITDLGFHANTDFYKLRYFYYYFFSDEEFMAMPDEVKEVRMENNERYVSRQSIARYTEKLNSLNMINRNTQNYIYYFAYKKTQRIVNRDEYCQAWYEYWRNKERLGGYHAIRSMYNKYAGIARKQPIPEINGIYNEQIEYMLSLIYQSIENEIETADLTQVMERLKSTVHYDDTNNIPLTDAFNWDV